MQADAVWKTLPDILDELQPRVDACVRVLGDHPVAKVMPAIIKQARLLKDIVHASQEKRPDIPAVEKLCAAYKEQSELLRRPIKGFEYLQAGACTAYEHFCEDHLVPFLRRFGSLRKFTSWPLESSHKFTKRKLGLGISLGRHLEDTIFGQPVTQVLRDNVYRNGYQRMATLAKKYPAAGIIKAQPPVASKKNVAEQEQNDSGDRLGSGQAADLDSIVLAVRAAQRPRSARAHTITQLDAPSEARLCKAINGIVVAQADKESWSLQTMAVILRGVAEIAITEELLHQYMDRVDQSFPAEVPHVLYDLDTKTIYEDVPNA